MIRNGEKKIIFDTNIIIDNPSIIENTIHSKFLDNEEEFEILIPLTILSELDNLKTNKEIGYAVRNAIKTIYDIINNEKYKSYIRIITDDIDNSYIVSDISSDFQKQNIKLTNDYKIILIAKKYNATLYTKDLSMSIIGKSVGIDVVYVNDENTINYNNVIKIKLTDAYEYLFKDLENQFSNKYSKDDIDDYQKLLTNILSYVKKLDKEYPNIKTLEDVANQWLFLFIEYDNVDTSNQKQSKKYAYIYALNPVDCVIERIDNKSEYKKIQGNIVKVDALDEYQMCLIYLLKNAPNVLVLGKYGSGKSLLTTAYALTQNEITQRKIFITRANIGLDVRYDIGYLKGDKNDKMINWLGGFLSATYYIYGNTKGQMFDYVKELFFEKFEVFPLNMIQGISILKDDIFIVDECQLINTSYMSMLLSRISNNGKLILVGDLKQNYNVIKFNENGLVKILKLFNLSSDDLKKLYNIDGDFKKNLAIIELKYSHRSELVKIADYIQDFV